MSGIMQMFIYYATDATPICMIVEKKIGDEVKNLSYIVS